MKAKRILKKIFVFMIVVILVIAFAAAGFFAFYKPTLIFDAADLTGEVTSGASGYLYGIAEDGVPSYNMVESLDISTVCAKTQGGLQHPIAEVGDVAREITANGKCDYIVVYLQDMFSTWYYEEENINELKKQGKYDWKEFLKTAYFPLIKKTITQMKNAEYHDKLVYCAFNECDNGVWFGTWVPTEDGGWNSFDDEGKKNFYEAWKLTYNYIKSLDANALIGGPGNFEYSSEKMDGFLAYASLNKCTPDVMIYHELQERSIYDWQAHVKDLKKTEGKYGISPDTPILVSEYGRMWDNGHPGFMAKYITQIENAKVYADQAYWLLANNLCNTAADYNTPNSAWWVYRWYADMEGQTMKIKIQDILHSDFEKSVKEKRELRYQEFLGVGSISDKKDEIRILASGADYKGAVKVKNLRDTALKGKQVYVTVSSVSYQGIAGQVYEPEVIKAYKTNCKNSIKVNIGDMNPDSAYYVVIREATDDDAEFENSDLFTRYEFEHGTLLGDAYTYNSAYASTGELNDMVGGMEKEGDGVEITVDAPEDGSYDLTFIYGNSNDGSAPDDRTNTDVNLSVDGKETVVSLENTVKSEFTTSMHLTYKLAKGSHTVRVMHNKGTYVLDSLLVKKAKSDSNLFVINDADRTDDDVTSFLAVAPEDGYYDIASSENADVLVDGAPAHTDENGTATVFLRRGLNYLDVSAADNVKLTAKKSNSAAKQIVLNADDAKLKGSAKKAINKLNNISYIDKISSKGGFAAYKVSVSESGTYKMTIRYSGNRENGVHAYNIDLVEDYITVSANKKMQQLYCRNTMSWDTFTTVTANIELKAGENDIILYNDGSNRFDNNESFAPHISEITISETQA